MSKIIFAAALLAVLTLTLAIGVTAEQQQARAVIDDTCQNRHSEEQCLAIDIKNTLKNIVKGFTNDDN
jgi:hypothetical protein